MERTARDALLRLLWSDGMDDVHIYYVHRGAPSDVGCLNGDRVTRVGKGFFEAGDAVIPFHRVLAVVKGEKPVFARGIRWPAPPKEGKRPRDRAG